MALSANACTAEPKLKRIRIIRKKEDFNFSKLFMGLFTLVCFITLLL